ncbi:MAG: primosomal protein N' [Bacteroidales bacterium]|nr:primosomal protein N' [Bacteroidales bacterium]
MENDGQYIDVLLPLALPRPLTYLLPAELGEVRVGQRVLVPLGRYKFYAAVVRRTNCRRPEGYAVKKVMQVLDDMPVADERQLAFWEWMASYYLSTEGEVLAAALPSGLKVESETRVRIHPDYSGEVSGLSARELQLVQLLSEKESMSLREIGQEPGFSHAMTLVQHLLEQQVLARYEEAEERYRPRTVTCLRLAEPYAEDESLLEKLFSDMEKNSRLRKQSEALLLFLALSRNRSQPLLPKRDVLAMDKVGESSLRQLVAKGILCQVETEISRLSTVLPQKPVGSVCLTGPQQSALEGIVRQWELHPAVLLHGVTGSGKTEIYIRLIQEEMSSGRQVLYLLPEIALTAQIINRLQCYFGSKVGVYQSRFNEQERVEIWRRVQTDDASAFSVVIGARSSVFLPFRNLGLIIVDEEHDASFKQYDPAPRYHARDAALVLARIHNAKVLLGSATPSVESYANVRRGKYGLVNLDVRYAGMELPEVRLVDLRLSPSVQQGSAPYSRELIERMSGALEAGEQVILFQNRRGFSPHLECDSCHYVPVCRHCDVALTYHKDRYQLRCHYCGYTESLPHECPQCGSAKMLTHGFGTERVEEDLAKMFPGVRVARLDYDTTRSRTAYQRIISDFEQRRIQVLVGTQMVTKGLDFDHVSTVGILNADSLLYFPDFRAYERAYQLMAQVSGRAGRKHSRGMVLIQTYRPEHPLFQWVMHNDYTAMYSQVMAERRQFLYPPFCRFIKMTLKHKDAKVLETAAQRWVQWLRRKFGNAVLGPASPPVPRIKNLYMKDVVLKISDPRLLSEAKRWIIQSAEALQSEAAFRSVQLSYDADPY